MKSFKAYLTESEKTYQFRIKLAHEADSDKLNAIESALEK